MRIIFRAVCVLFFLVPFFGYGQSLLDLDQAVADGVYYFSSRSPKGTRAAVLAIKSANSELGELVHRKISTVLVNGGWFTVVERDAQALETVSREMSYQLSGEVSDETSLSIGKQLGAEVIITGILERSGEYWHLDLLAIQVESAQIVGQWSADRIRPDPAWVSIVSPQTVSVSFAGDKLSIRDMQTIIDGLRSAMETWKTGLELKENEVSVYSFTVTVHQSQLPPAPPANISLLQAEADIVFSHNGRIISKAGPYVIIEMTEVLIARRIAEQLCQDKEFYIRVNEAIK